MPAFYRIVRTDPPTETEEEALAEVRWMIEQAGRAEVATWLLALGRRDEAGSDEPIIEGDDLLDRALRADSKT